MKPFWTHSALTLALVSAFALATPAAAQPATPDERPCARAMDSAAQASQAFHAPSVATFDKLAGRYAERYFHLRQYDPHYQALVDAVGATETASVLDLACGPGNAAAFLRQARPAWTLLCADLAPAMLKEAAARVPGIRTLQLDACEVGGLAESFRAMVSRLAMGGGVVAVELASMLARFGVRVTLLVREARVLSEFDVAVSEASAQALAHCGVDLVPNANVARVERDAVNGDGVAVYVSDDTSSDIPRVLRAQRVLAAIGRAPTTAGLGLDAAGVSLDARGGIAVDRHFRTRARGVHAVGDVSSAQQLTPVATAQGQYVAERLFGKGLKGMLRLPDMNAVPTAVFCDPAIATVGLTEADARSRWPDRADTDKRAAADRIDVVVRRFVSLEQRFAGTGMESLIKLVCNARSGRVLGAHIVDNAAPEIIQALAVAVRMGVRLKHLRTTVGLHPTVAEELLSL